MAEVAPWFQSPLYRVMRFFGCYRDEMADAVIEAENQIVINKEYFVMIFNELMEVLEQLWPKLLK